MSKLKVMIVFGTRPEAIKMAPVITQFLKDSSHFETIVAVTGQHRQMLDQVLHLFKITPDIDLAIMKDQQSLNQILSAVLIRMEDVIAQRKPDLVLVQGDTTSAFAAALCAFHHKIAVGHVEAGLRTRDKYNPFPEEINRKLIAPLADFHFAPTPKAKENLLREGVPEDKIHVTGNTGIDALKMVVRSDYRFNQDAISDIDFKRKKVITLTTHRRESFGAPMRDIFKAVKQVVAIHPDVEVVFPVHLNPQVRLMVQEEIVGHARIHLIDPLDYEPFVHLLNNSYLILTDSGGIQEEAPALGKPVLVLRETTERMEGITVGTARLVGTNPDRIIAETSRLLEDDVAYKAMASVANPYGDGHAAERIIEIIQKEMGGRPCEQNK